MKRGHEQKTELTPKEKLKAAAAYEVYGVPQHALAFIFEVNPGRIAEAITSVRNTVNSVAKENHQ
jgi:hypothetical protein